MKGMESRRLCVVAVLLLASCLGALASTTTETEVVEVVASVANTTGVDSKEILPTQTSDDTVQVAQPQEEKKMPPPPSFLRNSIRKKPATQPSSASSVQPSAPRLGKYFLVLTGGDEIASSLPKRCFYVKEKEGSVEAFNKIDCKNRPDPLLKRVVEDTLIEREYTQTEIGSSAKPDLVWLRISLPKIQVDDWPIANFKELEEWQRVNRFPAIATELNQKDTFARNYKRMQKLHGEQEFSFHPHTYLLPDDLEEVSADIESQVDRENPVKFIMKPCFGGQGARIKLIHRASDIPTEGQSDWLIQRYIPNPLTINGYKFTLRLYVVITSFEPLRIYIHNNGVAKFTTTKFQKDADFFDDKYRNMHITNQALNQNFNNFQASTDPNVDNVGSRWSLRAFREYSRKPENNIDDAKLWAEIYDLLVKSIISVHSPVLNKTREYGKRNCCFQLLGVDVDIDENLKPWFIEANVNPSLGGSQATFDNLNKKILMNELFDLLWIGTEVQKEKEEIKQRLLPNLLPESLPFVDDLVDYEYEMQHKGGFDLIYPTKEKERNDHYHTLFEEVTPADAALAAHITK